MLHYAEIILRLVAATTVSGLIGWERESLHKPAGLRTHMLVGVAATLMTLVSIDALSGEPGRVAAGIITGVGFLGAGTIFRARDHISGLTTAASIWAVAGLGIAIGVGYYVAAAATTVIMLVTLQIRKLEKK
jgi:putative Mg2+ transporter-C (MgtC) family protein